MTIAQFIDDLTALTFPSVATRYTDLPRELREVDLPASWVDMPSCTITTTGPFATFPESGVVYSAQLFVAVASVTEGYPAAQQAAVLAVADEIAEWAVTSDYNVTVQTAPRLAVGSREYRGVVVLITTPEAGG